MILGLGSRESWSSQDFWFLKWILFNNLMIHPLPFIPASMTTLRCSTLLAWKETSWTTALQTITHVFSGVDVNAIGIIDCSRFSRSSSVLIRVSSRLVKSVDRSRERILGWTCSSSLISFKESFIHSKVFQFSGSCSHSSRSLFGRIVLIWATHDLDAQELVRVKAMKKRNQQRPANTWL